MSEPDLSLIGRQLIEMQAEISRPTGNSPLFCRQGDEARLTRFLA
jgi:hypothetical protein